MKKSSPLNTKLFDFLLRAAPNQVFFSIILGIVSGLAYTLIIPLITQSIQFVPTEALAKEDRKTVYLAGFEILKPEYAYTFFLLVVFILITRTVSQVILQRVAIKATRDLRITLYDRISCLPTIDIERIGPSKIYASFANDIPFIMAGSIAFPSILISAATVIGLLGFLVYLNLDIFLFIIAIILFGVVTYRIPLYFGSRYFSGAREEFDRIQESIRGLVYGAKELKLNRAKQERFMEETLINCENTYCKSTVAGNVLVTLARTYGNIISFFAIGIAAFILSNHYGVTSETLVAIVMALLYITGPLGAIINNIGPVVRGSVALRKLNRLLKEMPVEAVGVVTEPLQFHTMRLREVKHSYPNPKGNSEPHFELGPIDLTLRRGEVTFLVGGNGSGKSTLGKLLTLHYIPTEGKIFFDDLLVTGENRDQCRQNISAIYSDFYLFEKLYEVKENDLKSIGEYYLRYLDLDDKVTINDGKFSTTKLSDGQKRRLALIVTYLEQRDIYLFDEWAADQDPQFREVFYTQILKRLKDSGKMVVVISHDDRYFHLADHIIRMEDGQICEQKQHMGKADAPASCKPRLELDDILG